MKRKYAEITGKGQTALGYWKKPKIVVGRKKKPPVEMATEWLKRKGFKNEQ